MKSQKRIVLMIILCLAALIAVGCGGAAQRKAEYLTRGKNYLKQENYDKALVELKNVVQIDPKDAEAYYLMGQAEEKRRNWQRSFANYSKAADLKPDYIEPRLRMSYFYLVGGDVDKASKMLDQILKEQPNNPDARAQRAIMMARKGDIKGATAEAEKVVADDPSQADAIELLTAIYAKANDTEKMLDVLKKGIAAEPKNITLRLQYAQLLELKKDFSGAEKMLQESIALQPDNLDYRVMLATLYSRQKQAEKAEKTIRDAIQANPDDGRRYIVLADFLISQKKADQAVEELTAAIKAKPKLSIVRFRLANLYEQAGALDKAAQVYRDAIDAYGTTPNGLIARNHLADLDARQGHTDEAAKLVDEVLKQNPGDNNALMIKGRLALARRDAIDATSAFRSVLRDQPNLVEAYLYLAEADMLNKDQALARDNLQKAVKIDPKSVPARLAVAKFYAYTGDVDSAIKNVDIALTISPNNLDVLSAKAALLRSKGDLKGMQAIFEKIKTAYPDKPLGYYQLGRLFVAEKKYDSAAHELELALEKSSGSDMYPPLAALVQVNVAQNKPDKAIARLNDILKQSPNLPFAYELLGEVFFSQKKYNDAEQSMKKAIDANPKWDVPYLSLANLSLVKGDFAAANQVYQQGLKAIPDDERLMMGLAGSYERLHDYDKAIAAYGNVLSKNSADDVAANNLASLLLDHSTDPGRLKRARDLATRFESSSQPAFLDTLGWMYYRSGELDKAIEVLNKVVKQAPTVGIFQYHLGMAYYKKGDKASARRHLTSAIDTKKDFSGIEEALATLKLVQ